MVSHATALIILCSRNGPGWAYISVRMFMTAPPDPIDDELAMKLIHDRFPMSQIERASLKRLLYRWRNYRRERFTENVYSLTSGVGSIYGQAVKLSK